MLLKNIFPFSASLLFLLTTTENVFAAWGVFQSPEVRQQKREEKRISNLQARNQFTAREIELIKFNLLRQMKDTIAKEMRQFEQRAGKRNAGQSVHEALRLYRDIWGAYTAELKQLDQKVQSYRGQKIKGVRLSAQEKRLLNFDALVFENNHLMQDINMITDAMAQKIREKKARIAELDSQIPTQQRQPQQD